jgi:hypothetical protein
VGRTFKRLILLRRAARDGGQRVAEAVEFGFGLRLGRLDQHRTVDDEREVHRHRVIALVDEALGDVDRLDARVLQERVREQRFVHAVAVERRRHQRLQACLDVVGVQHGVFGDLFQAVSAVAEDVGEARVNMPIWPWKAHMRPNDSAPRHGARRSAGPASS